MRVCRFIYIYCWYWLLTPSYSICTYIDCELPLDLEKVPLSVVLVWRMQMFPCSFSSCLFCSVCICEFVLQFSVCKTFAISFIKRKKIKTSVPDLETVSLCSYAMLPGISSNRFRSTGHRASSESLGYELQGSETTNSFGMFQLLQN